jgi:hypothetical protein
MLLSNSGKVDRNLPQYWFCTPSHKDCWKAFLKIVSLGFRLLSLKHKGIILPKITTRASIGRCVGLIHGIENLLGNS